MMIIKIILIILSCLYVALGCFFLKKSKKQQEHSDEAAALMKKIEELLKTQDSLIKDIEQERTEYLEIVDRIKKQQTIYNNLQIESSALDGKLKAKYEEHDKLNKIAEENEQQIKVFQKRYEETIKNIRENYENELKQLIETYENKEENYREELEDLRDKRNKAILVAVQEYEASNKENFYKLQLSEDNLNDIKVLKQIQPLLHNKEVLGKLLYKTYYEKPYTDLVGRVLEGKSFSGIYKITNTLNQMCYVGQAADIKRRWQQHIKRAVGAEALVNNKLYPAMIEFGVENFSFEVIDRCEKDKLNEREQYWQEFYAAKSFGYSIK